MSDRRFYKPANGLVVRDRAGTVLPPHGKGLEWDSWWQRRLNDGDIEATTEEEMLAAAKAAEDAAVKVAQAETRKAKAGAKDEETGK